MENVVHYSHCNDPEHELVLESLAQQTDSPVQRTDDECHDKLNERTHGLVFK